MDYSVKNKIQKMIGSLGYVICKKQTIESISQESAALRDRISELEKLLALGDQEAEKIGTSQTPMFASLGGRCEVAWQISNIFGRQLSGPFDWLVTPLQSIPLMISERLKFITDRRFLEKSHYFHPFNGKRLETVINTRYGVFLHHEFSRDESGGISDNWLEEVEQATSKWKFVTERWFDTITEAPDVIFVRQRGRFSMPEEQELRTCEEDYLLVLDALKTVCPQARLAVADPGCQLLSGMIETAEVGISGANDWTDSNDYWKGATNKWQPFLRKLAEK